MSVKRRILRDTNNLYYAEQLDDLTGEWRYIPGSSRTTLEAAREKAKGINRMHPEFIEEFEV